MRYYIRVDLDLYQKRTCTYLCTLLGFIINSTWLFHRLTDDQLFEDAYFFNLSPSDDGFMVYEEVENLSEGSTKETTIMDGRESVERDAEQNGHIFVKRDSAEYNGSHHREIILDPYVIDDDAYRRNSQY